MRGIVVALVTGIVLVGGVTIARTAALSDKITVETQSVGLDPRLDPGMYVCSLGHLHIKGTVQNLTGTPVGHVKVAGKVFDAEGKLLGTATALTKPPILKPGENAEINLEFLTVTGPLIQQVKKHELAVVSAEPGS